MNRRAFIVGLLASTAAPPTVTLTPPDLFSRALAEGGYTVFTEESFAAAWGRIRNQIIENVYRGPPDPSPGLQVF